MAEQSQARGREVALYIDRAHQMLAVAVRNLDDGFYASAVNGLATPSSTRQTPCCLPRD